MVDNRITQAGLYVVDLSNEPLRMTQLPIYVLSVPFQEIRTTQLGSQIVFTPYPIPFPVPIVPETPVTEIWEWKTQINQALNSKEQRVSFRTQPRVSMEFNFQIQNDVDRQTVVQLIMKWLGEKFNYPMYQHSTQLTQVAFQGAVKLYFDTSRTDLRPGESLALFDASIEKTTMYGIDTVDADGATLSSPLLETAPIGLFVCPAPLFKVPSSVGLQMSSISGNMSVTLDTGQSRNVLRPNQSTSMLLMVDDLLVLDKPQLANSSVEEDYTRNTSWIDNGMAPAEPRSYWRDPLWSGSRDYLAKDLDYWRAFGDYAKGQQNPFLLPTFREDLPLYSQPELGATVIRTSNVQFFDFKDSPAYRYIMIRSNAGTIYRKIDNVQANFVSGIPVWLDIHLSSSIGAEAGSNVNMKISFCNLVRLGSDKITFLHDGVESFASIDVQVIEE